MVKVMDVIVAISSILFVGSWNFIIFSFQNLLSRVKRDRVTEQSAEVQEVSS